ncbi:MAG: HlyD family efflux transporter periplasmic adaptor subunit [Treponema sp.]|nr:HlyD family efflux transporter periplasmic adaptor subunit [Treponema sp.]
MYLKSFKDMKQTSVFFLLKPVNSIYVFIISVCLVVFSLVIWACLAPMDDVVKADVILRPVESISSIKCVTSGELYVKNFENDMTVNAGDLLFSLDTTALQTELESYKLELQKNEGELFVNKILLQTMQDGSLPNLPQDSDAYIKSAVYIAEKSRYQKLFEDAERKWNRERTLPKDIYIPQNVQDLENQKEQIRFSFESWLNSQKVSAIEQKKSLESSRRTMESRIIELERTIRNSTIYAPISGRITEVLKLNKGDYLIAGSEILRIVPEQNGKLKADIYVDSSYIARVKEGDAVHIKFPGLPPSRYGQVETNVSLIPPDATLSSSGTPVFVVEALVPDTRMKTRSGNLATLIPGITAQARIVTERSTVMQMLLRKLDFIN